MFILRIQNRILLGFLILLLLLMAAISAAWYRIEANHRAPPVGARLVLAGEVPGA